VTVDKWLGKKYDAKNYDCLDWVCDVWLDETGEDLRARLEKFLGHDRKVTPAIRKGFKRLKKPSSPCIVVMTRKGIDPHIGVFLRGKLGHLHSTGPEFLPVDLASRGFTSVTFYQ